MIEEYDVVKALRELSVKVPQGSKGTVLIQYPDYPSVFEVEFMNEIGETLDVLTVRAVDIVKI
jgi:hypothetical protein